MFAFIGMPGPTELIIIGIIGILLFGKRLPSAMKGLGQGISEFKKGIQGVEDEVKEIDKEIRKDA